MFHRTTDSEPSASTQLSPAVTSTPIGRDPASIIASPVSLFLAISTTILWGATGVTNRIAVDAFPPVAVGGIRFAMAAAFMVGWCLVERSPLLLKGRQWRTALEMGVLLFLQIATFNLGLARSNSSHASLFVNSFVFWVAAYEHFIARSITLRWWQMLGLALAGSGCALLLLSAEGPTTSPAGDQVTLTGDLILLLSGFILALKILQTKHAVRDAPVGAMILWHNVFGTILFFGFSYLFETYEPRPLTTEVIVALLIAGLVISGFCFSANAWLLKRHGASQVAVFGFASPVCGVILGIWWRGDQLTPWLFVSGICVGIGILLVNLVAQPMGTINQNIRGDS